MIEYVVYSASPTDEHRRTWLDDDPDSVRLRAVAAFPSEHLLHVGLRHSDPGWAKCGACNRMFPDIYPGARCPFEYDHPEFQDASHDDKETDMSDAAITIVTATSPSEPAEVACPCVSDATPEWERELIGDEIPLPTYEQLSVFVREQAAEIEGLKKQHETLRETYERAAEIRKSEFDQYAANRNAEVERYQESLASAERRATTAKQQHERDIALIGEKLLEEADERGWCEQFDDVVEELNRKLIVELPTRERDYNVQVTITVAARNEDAAEDLVRNMLRRLDANYNIDGTELAD